MKVRPPKKKRVREQSWKNGTLTSPVKYHPQKKEPQPTNHCYMGIRNQNDKNMVATRAL